MKALRRTVCLVLAVTATVGCGGASDSSLEKRGSGPTGDSPGADAGRGSPGGGTGGSGGSGGAPLDPVPPEMEERRDFEAPRAGARFVYVANPRRDTVAVIDSTTLAIRPVQVGDTPSFLQTLPAMDVALVINVGSRDVSILRTDSSGATRTSTVPVVPGVNAISVAADGRHAIAWFDSARRAGTSGAGSFQDVSLITFGEREVSIALTVGFRPSAVAFSADAGTAFVVTEDGISVIRFADVRGPVVAPLLRFGDSAGATVARDVSITSDGRWALARREGGAEIQLVDLSAGSVVKVDLGSPVTDLDLAPAGTFAVAVLRATGAVVRLPIPAGFSDPQARQVIRVEGEQVGSVSITPDGKTAVLYTTATSTVERLVLVDLEGGGASSRPVRLKKGVRSVAVAPDSRIALVVHTKEMGDPKAANLDVEVVIDRSYGYSVVDLSTGFAKLQLADAPVGELAITPDASRAFVLLRDDVRSVRIAQRIHLGSFIVDDFPLGSPPVALAALADSKRVFVSQSHPEGRISFIHWETGAVESVTGFELNGRIVQ